MALNYLIAAFLTLTLLTYAVVAFYARAVSTSDFYVAGRRVPPLANGMAVAADWISAASFMSLVGIIALAGRDGSVYLLGWTGGLLLLALLLMPYLYRYGQITLPDFFAVRYVHEWVRLLAVFCILLVAFIYIIGQMRGVGIVFSRFLFLPIEFGTLVGILVVVFYTVLGGMKGVTYTQVAQFCVLLCAFLVPAFYLSDQLTGSLWPVFGGAVSVEKDLALVPLLDQLLQELGFVAFTQGQSSTLELALLAVALICGSAALPHILMRFFTLPRAQDVRTSAAWALLFVVCFYTLVASVAAMSSYTLIRSLNGPANQGQAYDQLPDWFRNWENAGLLAWHDHNQDGKVQWAAGDALASERPNFALQRGESGERLVLNPSDGEFDAQRQPFANEVYLDPDMLLLAVPEMAHMPDWVVALLAAGAVAAALSTSAGLLLVIAAALTHDLLRRSFWPNMSERQELKAVRIVTLLAVLMAGYLALNPPAAVAEMVALAFGVAAATLFPPLLLGVLVPRMNAAGAGAGMLMGLLLVGGYLIWRKLGGEAVSSPMLELRVEAFCALAMLANGIVACITMSLTRAPDETVQQKVRQNRHYRPLISTNSDH